MLTARFKPDPLAFPGDRTAIARCGFPTCGGMLARVGAGTDASGALCWSVSLEAGFLEVAPDVWRLTRHAASVRNRRHTPRRLRTGGVTGFPITGLGSYALSNPHVTAPLYRGDVLTIYCPDHGHMNTVSIADAERDIHARLLPDPAFIADIERKVAALRHASAGANVLAR